MWLQRHTLRHKSAWLGEKRFDRHKKEPRAVNAPGVLYELLPQLVGFCAPGGVGVSGDGMPPGSLLPEHMPDAEYLRIVSDRE